MPKSSYIEKEFQLTRFDGGIIDDIRESSSRGFQISAHFDIFTNPLRLTPHRSTEANETKTQDILRFIYASGKLYGYGVAAGNDRPAIYYKASNNITDAWTAPTANECTTGTSRNVHAFFHYKNYLYGWRDGTTLWRWGDLTGTPTFTDTYQSINYDFVCQPVVHPADGVAYFATNNKIHTLNDTTFTNTVITLPDNYRITDLEPVGNLLAIACRPVTPGEKSIVFLWDRDSSSTTFTGKIDWGEGMLLYIAYLDGLLIGITDYFLNDTTLNVVGGKFIVKIASGEKARTIKEIQKTVDDTTTFIPNTGLSADGTAVADGSPRTKIIRDNKIYFPVAMSDQSETFRGVGVVTSDGRVTMELVEQDASGGIQGIFLLGNYWFIAHTNDGSVNRTDNDGNYTYTSLIQTQKYNIGDASKTKKLKSATVMHAPLPAAGQVVLKYRKDEETTWTTIFTHTTDNSISHTSRNIESTGVTLTEFKEIQFRIESTGGAEITGYKFKVEELDKDIA